MSFAQISHLSTNDHENLKVPHTSFIGFERNTSQVCQQQVIRYSQDNPEVLFQLHLFDTPSKDVYYLGGSIIPEFYVGGEMSAVEAREQSQRFHVQPAMNGRDSWSERIHWTCGSRFAVNVILQEWATNNPGVLVRVITPAGVEEFYRNNVRISYNFIVS